jgi:murein L,D-transpeptidase YcbB/YkuD
MTGTVSTSTDLRAGRHVRPARISHWVLALAASAATLPALAQPVGFPAQPSQSAEARSIADFYAVREGRPLWLGEDGTAGEAVAILLDYLRTAEADGLQAERYRFAELSEAVRLASSGSDWDISGVDRMLSEAFVAYVRDLKQLPHEGVIWVDPELRPKAPNPVQLLESAAGASSLEAWLVDMRWMHPMYAGLRRALVEGGASDRQLLRLNLERARTLPANNGRYIIVNATSAELWAYEGGQVVDTMRVIVGKPRHPTPMMAALIRYASLNPYWYVPPDLAAERIAPNVVKDGVTYLNAQGYQVLSDWSSNGQIIDPSTIDWTSVASGKTQVWMRQLPGPANAMGDMKFMFPNSQGVYLHDTPQKELLAEASRMFSGGCVRLEDAPRLARWLFGRPIQAESGQPELKVDLPEPVPVYITYLTMVPSGSELATYPDVYGRDRQQLVSYGAQPIAAR